MDRTLKIGHDHVDKDVYKDDDVGSFANWIKNLWVRVRVQQTRLLKDYWRNGWNTTLIL